MTVGYILNELKVLVKEKVAIIYYEVKNLTVVYIYLEKMA